VHKTDGTTDAKKDEAQEADQVFHVFLGEVEHRHWLWGGRLAGVRHVAGGGGRVDGAVRKTASSLKSENAEVEEAEELKLVGARRKKRREGIDGVATAGSALLLPSNRSLPVQPCQLLHDSVLVGEQYAGEDVDGIHIYEGLPVLQLMKKKRRGEERRERRRRGRLPSLLPYA
jgi:hypothetical protein